MVVYKHIKELFPEIVSDVPADKYCIKISGLSTGTKALTLNFNYKFGGEDYTFFIKKYGQK